MQDVIFHIDNNLYPFKYDRSRLMLGKLVYVEFDDQGQAVNFTSHPSETSILYAVTWIAPNEWHVTLQNKFRLIPYKLTAIYSAVEGYADKPLVDKALEETQKDFRLKYLYKTKEYKKSRLSVIVTVAERLDLVTRFQKEGVAKELFHQHESLCVYLLLTCFDRLGQTANWYDFGKWLTSDEKSAEREELLKSMHDKNAVSEKISHEEYNKLLYKEYNKTYGTISAFHRFLHEILPSSIKQELLDSIEYSSIPNPPDFGITDYLNDKGKEDYLIRLRNEYTHSATFVSGIGKNWQPNNPNPLRLNISVSNEQWIEEEKWFNVKRLNWPDVIEKSVRIGLAEYLKIIITP